MSNDIISQLKDIHLPQTPSVWPLTYGWYILVIAIILIAGIVFYLVWQKWKKKLAKKMALKKLAKLEVNINNKVHDPVKDIAILSILLRRTALAYFNRAEIAGLIGEEWLKFLDQTGGNGKFIQGIGRSLISAPYEKTSNINVNELLQLVRDWIKQRK